MPAAAAPPVTLPAMTLVWPVPELLAQIPWPPPATVAAETSRCIPDASLEARIPSPAAPDPVTLPVVVTDTEPPPAFVAWIPCTAPRMS